MAHQLHEAKAKIVIGHPLNVETAFAAADLVGLSKSNIFIFGDDAVKGAGSYSRQLLGSRCAKPFEIKTAEQAQETLAFLCFSSGTRGTWE